MIDKKIWGFYQTGTYKVSRLAESFRVSRPAIYKILGRARNREFVPRNSGNDRYRCLKYGLKRLGEVEKTLEHKRKQEARRYNKAYPGEMAHFDNSVSRISKAKTRRSHGSICLLPLMIIPENFMLGSFQIRHNTVPNTFLRRLLTNVLTPLSDNGKEYKGTTQHGFGACTE